MSDGKFKPFCTACRLCRRAYYSDCAGCMARMEKAQQEIDARKPAPPLAPKESM